MENIENLKIELILFKEETNISFKTLRRVLEDIRFCESTNTKIIIKTEEENLALNKIFEIRNKYSQKNQNQIDIILFIELYNLIKEYENEKENVLRREI